MLHYPATQISLRTDHRVIYLALRTEHNSPDKPSKPMYRARYIAEGAEESQTPADPEYTWAEPIPIEHEQKVTVGARNPEPDGHPNFTSHEPTLRGDSMKLYRAMGEYVRDEMRMLEEGVGIAVVDWFDNGEVSERVPKIEVGKGDAKKYIWWEVMKCNIF
jgi:hypothetical protein